jgi:hypothetical protein
MSDRVRTTKIAKDIRAGVYFEKKGPFVGTHDDTCLVCKGKEKDLLHCTFCKNSQHLKCFLTCIGKNEKIIYDGFKIQVGEDIIDNFICHKHVNHIMSMKKRATERVAGKEERALNLRRDDDDDDVETETESKKLKSSDGGKECFHREDYPCTCKEALICLDNFLKSLGNKSA